MATMAYDKPTAIRIRDFLIKQGMTLEGAYGFMANLYVESGFRSNNAQNSCMKKLGMTDEIYTAKVDNGEYKLFCSDRVGYGLVQHTSAGRKTALYNYAKSCGVSIGDENMQLNFIMIELNGSYKSVLNKLKTSHDISECAKYVMLKYERPANQSVTNQNARASYGLQLYKDLEGKEFGNMSVNNKLEIRQCILTNNRCYKQGKRIIPSGIVVHSTGANNPYLKRYIQPDDGTIGKNPYANHWNTAIPSKCVHAFIGKDKDGVVRIYQTLPWDYRCWGCGKGKKGTYNDNFIQFEICEDSLTDAKYFNEAFALAIELCAYLAKKYNISTNNILSHHESYLLGYGSNHRDCDHWLSRFGRNMDWFRQQVSTKIGTTVVAPTVTPSVPTTPSSTISISKFTPLKGNQTHFANIIKNIKSALNVDYGLKFTIDSNIDSILLVNLSNVVLSTTSYKPNITYALQQLLKWWGYTVALDGNYNDYIKSIVMLFQGQTAITQTGTTTKEFWYKILGK